MPSVALTHELSFTSTTVGQQLVFPLLLRGNGPRITADWLQWAAFSLDPPGKHPAATVRPLSQADTRRTGGPKVSKLTTAVRSVFLLPRYDALLFCYLFSPLVWYLAVTRLFKLIDSQIKSIINETNKSADDRSNK